MVNLAPDQKQTKMREQKTNGSEVTGVDVGVQKRLQVGDIAECCTHSNQLSAGCQANTPTSFKLLHSAQISLHFIYSLKYIRFKIQTQCTQCNLQQSGLTAVWAYSSLGLQQSGLTAVWEAAARHAVH